MSSDQIDYDVLPYASLPFPQTQPARIAALALLHGWRPAEVETATVLELGCASGGNLIPLAARFPNARFEGVDLADRHIEDGKKMIGALGLENIELRQGDIARFQSDGRKYDFIICHGVFSWTPSAVQEAILQLCADTLSDSGLAYVSYNTLPGWSLRQIIREICQQQSYPGPDPIEAIAHARNLLKAYTECLDTKTPFGAALSEEIEQCARMSDTHFRGEFLGAFNMPCYFNDFVKKSEAHGLSYVCDAAPPEQETSSLDPLLKATGPVVTDEAAAVRNQTADFVSGRKFRRSILRKSGLLRQAKDGNEALRSLHFACPMKKEAARDGALTFSHGQSKIRTNDPVAGGALSVLSEVYPETRTLEQIAEVALGDAGSNGAEAEKRLHDALLQTINSGHVTVSTTPFRNPDIEDERPEIWPVARAQIEGGMTEVSSRLHEPVAMRGAVRFIASLMDGCKTRQSLVDEICRAASEGRVALEGQALDANGDADPAKVSVALNHLLNECRRGGLLAAPGP